MMDIKISDTDNSLTPAEQFRQTLERKGVLIVPGVYDCLSAKIVERIGFVAAYLTGHGISVSMLGKSDFGLTSMSEVVERSRQVCHCISVPLIVDADTGYGSVLNVHRTVRELESAGVAAIQLEDQAWPKKCGHMEGKELIQPNEMSSKIKAALETRTDPNICLIARTDALAVEGMDLAIERAKEYERAGADIIFFDGLETYEELIQAASSVSTPLMANMVEGGKTPYLPAEELYEIGYKIVIFPLALMYAGFRAMEMAATDLCEHGHLPEESLLNISSFSEFNKFMDLQDLYDFESKFNDI